MLVHLSPIDVLLSTADGALRTLAGRPTSSRPYPAEDLAADDESLTPAQRALSAALMRVNHVGEICAQALYEAQALGAADPRLREPYVEAAREETDHLAWTERRIAELGGRTSLLNPLWYGGAFAIGVLAAKAGDSLSLGFMAETEAQVEQHLQGHLDLLPQGDAASRAVVERMQEDEARHGQTATDLGGARLPLPVRLAMRVAAKVMTVSARHV